MATRCCWPPDSWFGLNRAVREAHQLKELGTSLAGVSIFSLFDVEGGKEHVFEDRCIGQEVEILEYEADVFVSEFRKLVIGQVGDVPVREGVLSGGGNVEASDDIHQGGFA